MIQSKKRSGLIGKRALERQRKQRDEALRKELPQFGLAEFEYIVDLIASRPTQELQDVFPVVGGREISLREALSRCWNCTTPLTGPLRRTVADILNNLSPRVIDGRHVNDAYWGAFLYGRNVSHAARALRSGLDRLSLLSV